MIAQRPALTLTAIVIIVGFCLGFCTGCSDDDNTGTGPSLEGSVVGDWYIDEVEVRMLADDTYALSDNVLGTYSLVETGTYSLDREAKQLSFSSVTDLNGGAGITSGPGQTITIPVVSLTDEALTISVENGRIAVLSAEAPVTPEGVVTETFGSGQIDWDFWSSGGDAVTLTGGRINLTATAGSTDDETTSMYARVCGYKEIEADVRFYTSDTRTNGILRWNPFGDQAIHFGVHCGNDGARYIFSQVWEDGDIRFRNLQSADPGTYYNLKMTWYSNQVRFYVNGQLRDTYQPSPADIICDYTRFIGISSWADVNRSSGAYFDNIILRP